WLPQLDAQQLELAVMAARPAGDLAAQPHPHRRTVARQLRQLQRGVEAVLHRQRAVHDDRLQRDPLWPIALRHVFAPAVAVDLRRLGHASILSWRTAVRRPSTAPSLPRPSWPW